MPKKSTSRTQKQLVVENKDLHARLDEAEAILRAIRSGEVDALIVSGVDGEQIVTLKQVEEALRASEEKFRRLVEGLPSVVYMTAVGDASATLYISLQIMAQLGYTPEEWLADPGLWSKTLHPEDRQNVLTEIADSDRRNKPFNKEYRRISRDGRLVWVHDQSLILNDLEGMPKFRQGIMLDISASKQAEEALRESEKRFRSLYENIPTGIYRTSVTGKILLANPALVRMLGYETLEDLTRQNLDKDGFGPGYRRDEFHQRFKSESAVRGIESTWKKKDGTFINVRENAKLIRDADGNALYYEGTVEDITERKQAEEALRESEERFSKVFYASPAAISVTTLAEGRFVEVNDSFLKLLGQPSRKEVIGRSVLELGAGVSSKYRASLAQALRAHDRVSNVEAQFDTLTGEKRDVLASLELIELNGQACILTLAHDITERKRAEESLRESEERYRLLVETLPDGVVIHSQGRVVFANPASATIIGAASSADLIGKPVIEFVHPDYRERALKRIQQSLSEDVPASLAEEKFVRLDGTPIDIEASAIPFSYAGKPAMLTVFNDITERKQGEEQMRQRLAELEAVHTISTALRAAQTRDEALPILLDETLTVLETDAGAVWLYHADSGKLHAAVTRGWYRQLSENPMKPGESVAGTVFTSGQTRVSAEIVRDPLVHQPAAGEIPAGWGGVCLPIRTGAIPVGVLFAAMLLPRQITTEQVKLLESLTGMAGTTLHRMSLHEETVRQLDRLEALHSVDLAIAASMDLHLTLNVLLEQVIAQLKVDAADVLLLNPHTLTLEHTAGRGFRTHTAQTAHIRLGESFAGRAALERRTVRADDPAQIQENPQFAALWAGEGFAACYSVPLITKGQVKGVLEVFHRAPFYPQSDWISFLETLAGQAAIAIDSAQLFENLQRSNADLALAYNATIEGWSRALDLRDRETEGHTLRVTEITLRLAKAMDIGDAELVHIRRGALLHDIGKMGVPDSVLLKPGPLTDDEWKVMRLHPQLAYNMLSSINYLRPALDIPYCHHEKWDGSGYPRGLKGEQIPLAARIFAVVDVWDALISARPYRPAWSRDKAMEYIREQSGKHFDAKVVEMFLEMVG